MPILSQDLDFPISNVVVFFCVQWKWEVIVRFTDICGIDNNIGSLHLVFWTADLEKGHFQSNVLDFDFALVVWIIRI